MAKATVAIEGSLTDVSRELKQEGYNVVDLTDKNARDADVVVITGEDDNVMGMSDISTKAPVIKARGLSAIQIKEELRNRLF